MHKDNLNTFNGVYVFYMYVWYYTIIDINEVDMSTEIEVNMTFHLRMKFFATFT